MNGGLSYTCNVELKNMIMALRISRVMETRKIIVGDAGVEKFKCYND